MLDFHKRRGAVTFDYGNNIRGRREGARAWPTRSTFPGFVPAYVRPLFCEGKGPFRWVALSGDPKDIYTTDAQGARALPRGRAPAPLARHGARRASRSRGCPRASAGSASASAHKVGLAFNELVASGELQAPIVIGRDHLDTGSVASPNRETEGDEGRLRRRRRLAAAERAAVNRAAGATWVSIHHGGGVGMGYSQHAGLVIVGDGTPAAAAKRLERVLSNDPAIGVVRHADAGYEQAIDVARSRHVRMPMLK